MCAVVGLVAVVVVVAVVVAVAVVVVVDCVSKNVPPLLCYNSDIRKHILVYFGRNVTYKVSNQKHFTVPPQITCVSALRYLAKRGNTLSLSL